ncbi:efflux RND transporter periplasmic adaptor subunit [Variovorax sp. RHLX14]|uniref:efflux RND transporter periplasmic adaptor subunit n=1 Tax=Variovorax sp. RHLX14 TaxID=1259731 RepID=UPI003F462672
MARRFSSPGMVGAIALVALLLGAGGAWWVHRATAATVDSASAQTDAVKAGQTGKTGKSGENAVEVSAVQAGDLEVGPVSAKAFVNRREAIGYIDFNQDNTVPVFTAYQGRIAKVLAKAGDDVKAGQVLYTVAAPDVAQAASTLITSAATLSAATQTLKRAKVLAADDGIPQKELIQNQVDFQTAQANFDAARKSLRLFGLSEAEIANIERSHAVDIEMPVRSPISGRVTARAAQAGLLVQPGASTAPMTVSDVRTLWMVATVPESEMTLYRIGQPVQVRVQAYPGKTYDARVSYVGDAVDANSRRLVVRADVKDPAHELRPQMTADFSIELSAPEQGLSVPARAVVRENDGSYAVWAAVEGAKGDGQRFERRAVTLGHHTADAVQVTGGLRDGERIARRNALFLSNLYAIDTQ